VTRFQPREPVNTITHGLGVPMALIFTLVLVGLALRLGVPWWPFAIFGASTALVYTASSLYHGLNVTARVLEGLRRFDHSAIYVSIAGSFTPMVWVGLPDPLRTIVLIVIWVYALVGVLLKSFARVPEWISITMYVIMGWLALPLMPQFVANLPRASIVALVIGGALYTVGVAFYASRRKGAWLWGFGPHEVWHLFVLGGSVAHFVMVFKMLAV
jgi:hemolysin III